LIFHSADGILGGSFGPQQRANCGTRADDGFISIMSIRHIAHAAASFGAVLLSGALLWTSACSAAGMRAFENVPLANVPAAISAGQDMDVLEAGYLDVTRPPYNADPSGATDASAAIQAAIYDGYQYNFAVYVPKGTYLLAQPIEMVQLYDYQGIGASNRKFANQLIGDTTGGNFPVLKAADGVLGGNVLVNIYFSGPQPETRHYNALIRGFVIDMGDNPDATALSLNGAQYCSIEDVVIRGEDFDIGVHNLPGSGGSTTNLKVIGGNTGILQANYRPTPSVHGLELLGQSQRGIHHTSTRGSLILAGFRIEGSGAGYVAINTPNTAGSSNPALNLVLVDGSIELSGGAQVALDSRESSLYLRDVYVRAPIISRNGNRPGSEHSR
jgi:Pectate lyase superfamily protein